MKFVCVSFQEIAFHLEMHRDPIGGYDDMPPELAKQYRRRKYLSKKLVDNQKKEVEKLEKVLENSIYAIDEEEFVLELVSKLELF